MAIISRDRLWAIAAFPGFCSKGGLEEEEVLVVMRYHRSRLFLLGSRHVRVQRAIWGANQTRPTTPGQRASGQPSTGWSIS
jgi:hypothetical protein